MKQAARHGQSSTQAFTEILDIRDNVVLMKGGNACLLIQLQAVNFALLSSEEQDAKVYAYAGLLNSLSFPVQIVMLSEQVNILPYIESLGTAAKETTNEKLAKNILEYKQFVEKLVTTTSVLDKKFFFVISYSLLEEGIGGATKIGSVSSKDLDSFFASASAALHTKAESLLSQIDRMSLRAKIAEKDELIHLFQTIYNEKKSQNRSVSDLTNTVADLIAPPSVEVDFKTIRIGDMFYRTFFISGYPRYVSIGWLSPVIDFDNSLIISMFMYPVYTDDVLSNLKRKIAEMEATLSSDDEKGKPENPKVAAALSDALGLQAELAKGIERFFQFSFYIGLSASSTKELEEITKKLTSTLASLLVTPKVATLQMEDGFKTILPIGQDRLLVTRNMDTSSLASTFPFTSATLTQDKGVLYGANQQNGSLVIFDRYSLENANEVVFGKSGSGKSFTIKLEIMRQFMFGTEIIVIDPEKEYGKLADTLGGEHLDFSATSPVRINPFDLSGIYEEGENELGLKILSLRALLKIMLGTISPAEDAILDRALVETYAEKGITADPGTQTKTPPILEDLYQKLIATTDQKAQDIALRLEKYVKGSLSGIFNQQSNFNITNPLTIFSLRDLEDELRPIAMHIILDFVWTRVRKTLKKRLLIVDEAWYLMKYEDSASFMYGIAKRARKYYLGLTTATQDVQDFLSSDYGRAILSNSSIQILLKQSTSEIDTVAKTFYLSEGERQMLLSSGVGQGLFFAGQNHVAIQVVAAPFEHEIITSNPAELQRIQQKALTQPDEQIGGVQQEEK